MAQVATQDDPDHTVDELVTGGRSAARCAGPVAMPARLAIRMFPPASCAARSQRGVTTVEYIFGALIGIAIVGCIAALFTTGVLNDVAEGVMKWIFGQRPKTGG